MQFRANKPNEHRTGMVTVEMALTAPILFILIFGAIEFTRANMLMHTTSIAATEGARTAIIAGADASDVEQAVRTELSAVGIVNAAVAVEPPVITADTDVIAVGVGVPLDSTNGYVLPKFFLGKRLVKTTSMTREAKPSDKNSSKAKAARDKAKKGAANGQAKSKGKGKGKGKK